MFKRKEMLLCANVWAPGEKMCITPNKRDLLLFFKLFVYGLWPFSLLYVWSTQDSKRLCIILILSTLFLSHKQCFVLKLYFPGSDAVFTPESFFQSALCTAHFSTLWHMDLKRKVFILLHFMRRVPNSAVVVVGVRVWWGCRHSHLLTNKAYFQVSTTCWQLGQDTHTTSSWGLSNAEVISLF